MNTRILVLDDSSINIVVITNLLSKLGFNADSFELVGKALEAAAGTKYDLILTDYLMPEMNGIEFAKKIKKLPDYDSVPIIILTSEYTEKEYESFMDAGIRHVLCKPVNIDELSVAINECIEFSIDNNECSKDIDDEAENMTELISLFLSCAEERIEKICQYLEYRDIAAYTVEVHGVKGEARLINADELADLAHKLEIAGKKITGAIPTGETEEALLSFIIENNPSFIEEFKNTLDELAKFVPTGTAIHEIDIKANQVKESGNSELLSRISRYATHAIEALEAGDEVLTKNWLLEIVELTK